MSWETLQSKPSKLLDIPSGIGRSTNPRWRRLFWSSSSSLLSTRTSLRHQDRTSSRRVVHWSATHVCSGHSKSQNTPNRSVQSSYFRFYSQMMSMPTLAPVPHLSTPADYANIKWRQMQWPVMNAVCGTTKHAWSLTPMIWTYSKDHTYSGFVLNVNLWTVTPSLSLLLPWVQTCLHPWVNLKTTA